MATEFIPLISDLQSPFTDQRAFSAVATMIADIQPGKVGCVGDVLDAPQISRWTRGRAGEFTGDLSSDRDSAVQNLRDLRVTDLSRSNHDDRLEKYVREHAPGLAGLPELTLERFLQLDDLGITFHREPYEIAPGWDIMHGDEGTISKIAGYTALGLARRTGRNVVCGHTHRAGLTAEHMGVRGATTVKRWALEVGCLMDFTKASYLGGGITNWQHSIGMLVIDGADVIPFLLPIENGALYWDGYVYRG